MAGAGDYRAASGLLDGVGHILIVGCHGYGVGQIQPDDALPDPDDEGFSTEEPERLVRQSRRSAPRGDDREYRHANSLIGSLVARIIPIT